MPKVPQVSSFKVPKLPKVSAPTLPSVKIPKVPSLNSAKSGLQAVTASSLAAVKGRGIQIIVPVIYLGMLAVHIYILTKIPFTKTLGAGFGETAILIGIIAVLVMSIRSNEFDIYTDGLIILTLGAFTIQAYLEMTRTLVKMEEETKKK